MEPSWRLIRVAYVLNLYSWEFSQGDCTVDKHLVRGAGGFRFPEEIGG